MKLTKWLNTEFESSTVKTQQFKDFAKDFKKIIKEQLPQGYSLVSYNVGHFYISGFIMSDMAKHIYFFIPDVRGCQDWFNNILIRTASSDKDYTGGRNSFTSLGDFNSNIRRVK